VDEQSAEPRVLWLVFFLQVEQHLIGYGSDIKNVPRAWGWLTN
jgi:hypothetical protein